MKKYLLLPEPTGFSAEQLGKMIGVQGHESPLGPLLEAPVPFDLDKAMTTLDRAMHPEKYKHKCSCGTMLAGWHAKWCPAHGHDFGCTA